MTYLVEDIFDTTSEGWPVIDQHWMVHGSDSSSDIGSVSVSSIKADNLGEVVNDQVKSAGCR